MLSATAALHHRDTSSQIIHQTDSDYTSTACGRTVSPDLWTTVHADAVTCWNCDRTLKHAEASLQSLHHRTQATR